MSIKSKKRKGSSEAEVPAKIIKTNGDAAVSNRDINFDDTESISSKSTFTAGNQINFDKPLKIKIFRANLQKHFSITDVQHFVHVASKDSNYIRRYVEHGGRTLELFQLMEKIDIKQLQHVEIIFSAAQLVMIYVLSLTDDRQTNTAVQACNFLIKGHKTCIENLLKSTSVIQNKTVLKMLTTMVTLDADIGKNVLIVLDIITESENLKKYTTPVKTVFYSQDSLRTCFIHFMMSYIINGNAVLIRKLLERKKCLTQIFSGLKFDHYETIVLVINAFQEYFLKNHNISKTEKIQFFDLSLILDIINLYDWQYSHSNDNINATEQHNVEESVKLAVHGFLETLLTSRKHGIATAVLLNVSQKRNLIQRQVLNNLYSRWESEHHSKLIVKILQACPELTGNVLNKITDNITCNNNVLAFLTKLILSIEPHHLQYGRNSLKIGEISSILISSFFSLNLFKIIQSYIKDKQYIIRIETAKLLFTMFQQCDLFFNKIKEWNVYKDYELVRLRYDFSTHVLHYAPAIDTVIASVYISFEQSSKIKINILEHLEVTLNTLHIMYSNFTAFVEKTSSVINYVQMLRPIYNSTEKNTKIELKLVKFILELEPESISPSTKLFEEIFPSFIQIYVNGSETEQYEAKTALLKILKNTSLFENGDDEIELWLNALNSNDSKSIDQISNFLIKIIRSLKENCDEVQSIIKYNNDTNNEISLNNIKTLFYNIEHGVTVKGVAEVPALSSIFILALKMSPDKSLAIQNYLIKLSYYLYIYLPDNKIIIDVFSNYKSITINDHFKELINSDLYLSELHNIKNKSFIDIFSVKENGIENLLENFKLNTILSKETELKIFIFFLINHLIEQNNIDKLDKSYINKILEFIIKFLKIMKVLNESNYLQCLKYIFCQRHQLLQKFDFVYQNYITHFLKEILKTFDIPLNLTLHYRNKVINQIKLAAVDKTTLLNESLETLRVVKMLDENNIEIIKYLFHHLDFKDFLKQSIFLDLVSLTLQRIAESKKQFLNADNIKKLIQLYIDLIRSSGDIIIERYEDSLYHYLYTFPHSIEYVNDDFFKCLFENPRLSKTTSKLGCFLLERSDNFNTIFLDLAANYFTQKEIFYPILSTALNKNINIDQILINKIFSEYKNGIMKSIEKPSKAGTIYKENYQCSIKLIELCMPINETLDFCHKSIKMDSTEIFQCLLIRSIHQKAIKSYKDNLQAGQLAFVTFIQNWIQMMLIDFKKDPVDYAKIIPMIKIIFSWINDYLKFFKENLSFHKIVSTQNWTQFCRNCLKFGMKQTDNDHNSILLKIMSYICDCVYNDELLSEDCGNFFEMVVSHSSFFDIMLNQTKNDLRKTNLVYLLYVLVKKNTKIIDINHIKLYLGSYNATLSQCDRYILALLQFYEKHGISLYHCRPLLWGEAAVAQYSLRDETFEQTLNINDTSMFTTQSLFDAVLCNNSIENFPVWRTLDVTNQLPIIDFDDYEINVDEECKLSKFYQALNTVEKIVERGDRSFDRDVLKIAPYKTNTYDNIYDPAFVVPLMGLIFSPGSYSYPAISAQNGSLGIVFVSLSALDMNMRLAAGNALYRYRNHFETNNFLDKKLWIHIFDSVQNGLGNLSKDKTGTIPRGKLPATLFFAKLVKVISYPTSDMYNVLTNFTMVNNSFDFSVVPEFNVLFKSSEVSHVKHRYYILNIIINSIKSLQDIDPLVSSKVLKSIMGFFGTSYSDKTTDLLILKALNNCVKIPKAINILIDKIGILSWLSSQIENVESFKFESIDGLVNIMSNIWYSITIAKLETQKKNFVEENLLTLYIKLIPKLSSYLTLHCLSKFVNIFGILSIRSLRSISAKNIETILDCCHHYFNEVYCNELEYLQKNGSKYIETRKSYVSKLKKDNLDDISVFTLSMLRQLVANWCINNII